MCLAVPVKVISVHGQNALIDIDGVQREVNVAFIDKVAPGDYVVVHAGFAIQKWDEEDINEYAAIMEAMNESDSAS